MKKACIVILTATLLIAGCGDLSQSEELEEISDSLDISAELEEFINNAVGSLNETIDNFMEQMNVNLPELQQY